MKRLMVGLLTSWVLLACQTDGFYKGIEDLKDHQWPEAYEAVFQFDVKDTTQKYDLYYHVRNASQYPFYNLFISRSWQYPNGTKEGDIRNEIILFNEKTGEPKGSGLGDIWDHKVLVAKDIRLKPVGKHTVKLKQYMRQDPLPYIMSIGMSLEASQPK